MHVYVCICVFVDIYIYIYVCIYMYMPFKIYIKSKMSLFSEYISVLNKSSSALLIKEKAKN